MEIDLFWKIVGVLLTAISLVSGLAWFIHRIDQKTQDERFKRYAMELSVAEKTAMTDYVDRKSESLIKMLFDMGEKVATMDKHFSGSLDMLKYQTQDTYKRMDSLDSKMEKLDTKVSGVDKKLDILIARSDK